MHDAGVDAELDQDPIHQLLTTSGARWRTTRPEPAPVDPTIFVRDARRIGVGFGGGAWPFLAGVAMTLALVVGAAAIVPGWLTRPNAAVPGSSAAVDRRGGDLAHCPVTKPTEHFQPPIDVDISASKGWYGTGVLWTMLDRDGEVWDGLQRSEVGLTQKTFWWSASFDVHREQQPDIYVIGTRIGAPGRFGSGPGTNASGDFGSAMLVGVDVPEEGCWNLTAHYRGASLSYVVWVGPRS